MPSRKGSSPEVLLEHADDARALLVGEHVEHALGVLGRDAPRTRSGGWRASASVSNAAVRARPKVDPPLPLGPEGVGGRHLHEGGEGLVEPDAVPPLHGDEVAEPHVGQLVGDHVGHALQLGLGDVGGVDEQQHLAEGDAARGSPWRRRRSRARRRGRPCRPGRRCRSSRRRSAGERPDLEGEVGEVALAREVHDAQRRAVDVDGLGDLERPDDEGHQVGRHHHGVGERDAHLAVARWRLADLGGVGDGEQVVGDHERDAEDGLEVGLVPAGEGPPGVGGLELGGGDDLLVAVGRR